MNLRFEQPIYFWLLLALVPFTLLALIWFSSMSPVRRMVSLIIRLALLLVMVSMLAGLAMVRKTDRLAVVALIDTSGSVRRYSSSAPSTSQDQPSIITVVKEYLTRATAQRGPDDLVGVVAFDGKAVVVALPTHGQFDDRDFDVRLAEGTNIADAIRLGRALIPPDAAGRLLLITDGNQTVGDALGAAGEVSATGLVIAAASVPIDVVPLRYTLDREIAIESVDAPPSAAEGAIVNVRVAISSTTKTTATLQLLLEGRPLDLNAAQPGTGKRIELQPGMNVAVVPVQLDHGRVHRFRAIIEPDVVDDPVAGPRTAGDTTVENNRGESFTITPGKGSILLVGGPDRETQTLAKVLRDSGAEVIQASPTGLTADLLTLQAYDVIILSNVSTEGIAKPTQEALVAYVQDLGGGLVMIGGPGSFGAGGWKGTPVEAILPVKLDIPDKLVTPEVAIIFVLDDSGSMNRFVLGSIKSQQDIANESAAMAIRTLDRRDLVGVITFNSEAEVLWPLSPNTDPGKLSDEVESISAGGGTNMVPALSLARDQFAGTKAKEKHLVILSDGLSKGAELLPGIAEKMKADGITISTITVGEHADRGTMQVMASPGHAHDAVTATMLPKLFLQAIKIVRTPLIREEPFEPVLLPTGSPLTTGLDAPPVLGGLVLTQARPEPTIFNAMVTPQGEPLLSHWNVGLGQVVAFTSDASEWAKLWIEWPGYAKFWKQVVQQTSRPQGSRTMQATSQVDGETLRLHLEAMDDDGRPMERLDVPVTVYSPTGEQRQVRLQQTGPGTYEGSVDAKEAGTWVGIVKPSQIVNGKQRILFPVIVGSTVLEGVEYRAKQSNDELVQSIARRSGGRVLDINSPQDADLFNRAATKPREAVIPIWQTLLVWSLGLFLLDVASRRVAWDRWVSRRFRPELAAEAAADAARSAAAQRTVTGLKARLDADEPSATPAIALSEDDAARLAMAARDRRRAERLAAPRPADPAPAVTPTPPKAADTGLLAAKRRATERFEEE